MSKILCSYCKSKTKRSGKTSAGKQRWQCLSCKATFLHNVNNEAKLLKEFLDWLMSKDIQRDMPGEGRSFRRRTSRCWSIWALPPLIDEIHRVVYVDGIYLGRKAVVLIACSDTYVLGWYLARTENSRAWSALLSRIAPPDVVVSDGGSGFQKAARKVRSATSIQRCTFHAFTQVKRYTTSRPNLPAGMELYDIAKDLLQVKTPEQMQIWIGAYVGWCNKWNEFLSEITIIDGRKTLTHYRLVKARNSLNTIMNKGYLFTYLDDLLSIGGTLPATNNRIEGGVNAPVRQMLREHRGLSLVRRIKAVFWWCYLHTECPASPAEILKIMPTDKDIDKIYKRINQRDVLHSSIPQWGDAIVWSEFHHSDPWRHDWD